MEDEHDHSPINARDIEPTKDARVAYIADLMRELEWHRGKTGKLLAAQWGLSKSTLFDYAAEASRIVRTEVADPDEVGRTVCTALDRVLRAAVADGDRRNVINAAKEWATISGAKAAERHEVATAIAATPAAARRTMTELFGEVTPETTEADDAAESGDSADASGAAEVSASD